MKYLALLIAFAKIAEPLVDQFNAAVAEGKSNDPTTVKIQKILQDAETALQTIVGAL